MRIEFTAHRLDLRSIADYINLYGRGLAFEPGSKWEYSNYGFILLGRVVEKVSGMSYYDYVAKYVYAPAGMTSSGSEPEDSVVSNRAVGYTHMGTPEWQPDTNTLPWRGTSAGGGYSTVGDLLRFANALRTHKLLDAHYTELLTTGKVATPGGGHYGYGFGDNTSNGLRCIGHNGGAPGMNGDLQICDDGYVVAVLADMDPPAAGRISDLIRNRLPTSSEAGNLTRAGNYSPEISAKYHGRSRRKASDAPAGCHTSSRATICGALVVRQTPFDQLRVEIDDPVLADVSQIWFAFGDPIGSSTAWRQEFGGNQELTYRPLVASQALELALGYGEDIRLHD